MPTQVRFGIAKKIPFRAHGGGHRIHSTIGEDGFVIDLRKLNGIVVDPDSETVTVQAGALIGDLVRTLAQHERCTRTSIPRKSM